MTYRTQRGWVPLERSAWTEIRAILERSQEPWPRELAVIHLRLIADQWEYDHRDQDPMPDVDFPSPRELARTFSWYSRSGRPSTKRVRLLVSSGDWRDPWEGRAEGEVRARRGRGEGEPDTVETGKDIGSGRGEGEARARLRRGKGLTRVVDNNQHSTSDETRGVGQEPDDPVLFDGASSWAPLKRELASKVYNAYREHHKSKPPNPTDPEVARIIWAIEQLASAYQQGPRVTAIGLQDAAEYVCEIVDWAHLAPSARWLQGDNKDGKVHDGLVTPILKKDTLATKHDHARKWVEAGRPINPNRHVGRYRKEAGKAWEKLQSMLEEHGAREFPTEAIHPHASKRRVFLEALESLGGLSVVGQVRPGSREERELRERWVSCYTEARSR